MKRQRMLASVVRKVIAPILRECPQECGVTSLTDVVVSEDFSVATVYISALQEPEVALKFLKSKQSFLQTQLGSLYRSRIPQLRFRIDEQQAKANRLDELLKD